MSENVFLKKHNIYEQNTIVPNAHAQSLKPDAHEHEFI